MVPNHGAAPLRVTLREPQMRRCGLIAGGEKQQGDPGRVTPKCWSQNGLRMQCSRATCPAR